MKIFGKRVFVRWWNESETCYALGRNYSRRLVVRTLSMMAFMLLLAASSQQLEAQSYTTVTAANIQSDVSGVKLKAGTICFTPTDQNDSPINPSAGGGIVSSSRGGCFSVAAGAIAAGAQVVNTALSNPSGFYYRIQVTDSCAACSTRGKVVLDLREVAGVSGATWSLDGYIPNPGTLPVSILTVSEDFSVALENPSTGDTGHIQHKLHFAGAVGRISCSTDVGTASVNLEVRSEATPNTAGTSVMAAPLVCDTNSEFVTSFTAPNIPADAPIALAITNVSGASLLRVHVHVQPQ